MKEIHFYVSYSEKLNYADYIGKCIAGKEHSVIYNHIDEMNSCYQLVVGQLHYRLKQDISKTTVRINICAKSFEESILIVASLRNCMYEQAYDLYR